MNYSKKKMTQVADKPEGFWGRKMLNHMNEQHKGLIKWGLGDMDFEDYRDILDVGCGSGNSLSFMYKKNKKAHYFGIDCSKESVKIAKKNNKDAVSKGHIKIVHGDVCDLPYKNESFDLVISIESFYYWKNYEKAMKEISRVLKRNGKVVIVLEAHGDVSDPERYDELKQQVDMVIMGEEEFKTLFEHYGFQVEVIKKGEWIKVEGRKNK